MYTIIFIYRYLIIMLFRNKQGELVEILRKNYNNDKSYYNSIIALKYPIYSNTITETNKTTEIILNILEK